MAFTVIARSRVRVPHYGWPRNLLKLSTSAITRIGQVKSEQRPRSIYTKDPRMSVRICHVVGARPNYMKAAPVVRALAQYPIVEQTIIHTGQHYDFNMSDVFFQQLGMPEPNFNLQVGSGTHAQQTATIISHFEPVVLKIRPHLVAVYGDVNSTIAAALVCSKLGIVVAHVEAGLRSFDRTMPEEIN